MIVYTLGYSGNKAPGRDKKSEALKTLVWWLDGTLFDIRLRPRSRNPIWQKHALEVLLADRYQWVPELGNLNYKGGDIAIADMAKGLEIILASKRTPILMCACDEDILCHRRVVGMELFTKHRDVVSNVCELRDWTLEGKI